MAITLQKMAGGLLLGMIIAVALNLLVNMAVMPPRMNAPTPEIAASEGGFALSALEAKGAAEGAAAAPAAEDKPLPVRLAAASVDKGQATAKKCLSCHSFDDGGATKVGPNLYGVLGRAKGSKEGFAYSDAIKKLGGNWTYEDLDKFLTKPSAFASGTKMTFAGLSEGQDRADVIMYLHSISPNAPPPPK
jgi:cytochrome c